MRKDQPGFLVMCALFDEPGRHPQGQHCGDKPNQPGSGVKKEIGTDIKTKMKGALTSVKKQVEKNPAGFTLQNMR